MHRDSGVIMIQTMILDKYRIGSLQGQSILSYLSTFLCKWSYFPSGLIQYINNIYLWLPGQLIIIKRSHIGVLILFTIFEMYCRCVSYRNLKNTVYTRYWCRSLKWIIYFYVCFIMNIFSHITVLYMEYRF